MPLTRKEHWATRELLPFLMRDIRFVWGSSDCCLIAADAILAMTGVDIADDFRGKYSTRLGAWKTLRDVTGGTRIEDAIAYCAAKHGLQEWRFPLQAQRGDLVLIQNAGTQIGGFVHLNGRHAVSIGETGMRRFPLSAVARAWKV